VLTLSGGERRPRRPGRPSLAQTPPRIFLLDEPTNQLDPNHQLEALQLLRERAPMEAPPSSSLCMIRISPNGLPMRRS